MQVPHLATFGMSQSWELGMYIMCRLSSKNQQLEYLCGTPLNLKVGTV